MSKTALTNYAYTPISLAPQPYSHTTIVSQVPVESSVAYYDWGNTTSPLRSVTKAWADQFRIACEVNTLDNGISSGIWYLYENNFQLAHEKEYDYGLVSPSACSGINPAPPSPTPTRETVTNYQPFSINPLGGTIFDKPSSIQTYGNGSLVAETDFTYDNGVTSVTASKHDETYFGPGFTSPRGNVSSVTKKCLTGCVSPVTAYSYDETGQVTSAKDACGNTTCSDMTGSNHTTKYSYADNYTVLSGGTNSPYTPAMNTNAYLKSITNALGQSSLFSYDFNSGQLTSSQDPNLQTTSYIYNDPLARPTQVSYPDGGHAQYVYNDNAPSPTVTTCQLINGSSGAACSPSSPPAGWKTDVEVMDGMGHVVQNQLASDPDGITFTDTAYDGTAHVFTVSNPYRAGENGGTNGTTTYSYDALGRSTLQIQPDGTTPAQGSTTCPLSDICMTYSGNMTTVTDEAGTQRTRRADGLGRLTGVWEAPNVSGYNYETDYQYDALNNLLCAVQKRH